MVDLVVTRTDFLLRAACLPACLPACGHGMVRLLWFAVGSAARFSLWTSSMTREETQPHLARICGKTARAGACLLGQNCFACPSSHFSWSLRPPRNMARPVGKQSARWRARVKKTLNWSTHYCRPVVKEHLCLKIGILGGVRTQIRTKGRAPVQSRAHAHARGRTPAMSNSPIYQAILGRGLRPYCTAAMRETH